MHEKKNHYIIDAIQYANEHPDGFTQEELYEGIFIPEERRNILNHLFGQDSSKHVFSQAGHRKNKQAFHLTKKGVELLISIQNSEGAVQAAQTAKISLIITGAIAFVSLLLQITPYVLASIR